MAAIEFCEQTKAWRESFAVTFDAQNHDITPFTYAVIHQFETADFDDGSGASYRLTPAPYYASTPADRDPSTTSIPFYITQPTPDTITLIPYGEGFVDIEAIMKPVSRPRYGVVDATTWQDRINVLPTMLLDRYSEILAHGALARLLTMPAKPWSDPATGANRYLLFRTELDRLGNLNIRGQQRARVRTASSWV